MFYRTVRLTDCQLRDVLEAVASRRLQVEQRAQEIELEGEVEGSASLERLRSRAARFGEIAQVLIRVREGA